jgi:hypothetical protein
VIVSKKIHNRIFVLVLIIIFISTLFGSVYAENETTENSTNSVRQLSLQEQKNQVEEQIAIATEQLEYVEGEISEKRL